MATAIPNSNINIPYAEFLDPITGRPSIPWMQWLMNPTFITINLGSAVPVTSGGTGLTTIPTNGQLLIGNGTGYTLNTLGAGAGISVTNGLGTITVANTGVLSVSGGTTGLTPAAATTGVVTLAGRLAIANGGTNATATPTAGAVAYGTGSAYAFTLAGTLGQFLTSAGAGTPTWTTPTNGTVTSVGGTGTVNGITLTGTVTTAGNLTLGGALSGVSLTSQVSGILPVANGGNGLGVAYTVATLPTAGTQGRRSWVTDALAPVFLAAPTGGGAVVCPVFDNGSAWVVA